MEGNEKKPQPQFAKMSYQHTTHIRYLEDFLKMNPGINYAEYDLEGCDPNFKENPNYNNIHQKIYKKVVRDGYLDKTDNFARKSKRGGDQNFYNTADPFIDDRQAFDQKQSKQPVYSDFKSVSCSLQQFYSSFNFNPQKLTEAKRKPLKMQIPQDEKQSIMKKVKINRIRDDNDPQKRDQI